MGAAVAVAIVVAASRALLGVHWLTDVIAGLIVGWSWFFVVAVIFGGRLQRFGDPAVRDPRSLETSNQETDRRRKRPSGKPRAGGRPLMFDHDDTGNLLEADPGGVPARRDQLKTGTCPRTQRTEVP